MVDDFIRRDDARKALHTDYAYAAMDVIKRVPAADVAEVEHGRWVDNGIPDSVLCGCSVCGFTCGASSFFYCPNCGAMMDGGAKND